MDERTQDAWRGRLSEYVDGELGPGERGELERHLASCEACRGLAAELRGIAERARSLSDREPERDLWPLVRASLARRAVVPRDAPRRVPGWLLGLAAGVALVLLVEAARGWLRRPAARQLARGEAYVLLLHEPPEFERPETPEEHAAIVERYARWARDLGPRCTGGDELADGGYELRGGADGVAIEERSAGPEPVGGYFLLETAGAQEALALARTCPHLERGGWIEVRRVQQ